MFYKNNYRPAFATVDADSDTSRRTSADNGMMFNTANSETEDFNAFGSSQSRPEQKKKPQKPANKKNTFELTPKMLIIGAAAVVALILLIAVIAAIANFGGSDLKAKNNSFASYEIDGKFYVAMNGEVVGSGFENEIKLTPAADNSFAYIVEDTPDGYNLYLLDRKELTQVVPNPVSEVVATAELEPGIIYKDEEAVYFYADENEDRITKDPSAGNFVISPDASAVAYTLAKEENVNEFKLYLYIDGISESYASNMYPVAVSKGGEYIYAYGISSEDYVSKKLYLINPEDNDKINIVTGFQAITYMNIEGDEIIYCTGTLEGGFQSHIYNVKKNTSYKIGAGVCTPLLADSSVVRLATLKDIIVENKLNLGEGSISATYHVNKKYEPAKISQYNGTLNSDGDMFYFINVEGALNYIDLDDKNRTIEKIAEGVTDFVVTEKDNLYYIDDDSRLMFYKSSTTKKKRIADDVVGMSMNKYSNILYFEVEEDTKAYTTEEGSGKEIAEFERTEIQAAPEFIDLGQKRTFAYVINPDTELYDLYYTSSGKTYKLIASDCDYIGGVDIYVPQEPTPAPETPSESDTQE